MALMTYSIQLHGSSIIYLTNSLFLNSLIIFHCYVNNAMVNPFCINLFGPSLVVSFGYIWKGGTAGPKSRALLRISLCYSKLNSKMTLKVPSHTHGVCTSISPHPHPCWVFGGLPQCCHCPELSEPKPRLVVPLQAWKYALMWIA